MANFNVLENGERLTIIGRVEAAYAMFFKCYALALLAAALCAAAKVPAVQQKFGVPPAWHQGLLIAGEMAGCVALIWFFVALFKTWGSMESRAWVFDRESDCLERGGKKKCALRDLSLVSVEEDGGESASHKLSVVPMNGRPILLARLDYTRDDLHELEQIAERISRFTQIEVRHPK